MGEREKRVRKRERRERETEEGAKRGGKGRPYGSLYYITATWNRVTDNDEE